jgi:hypothetical protein
LLRRAGSPIQELDEVDQAVREHLSDPGTLMLPHLLFLAGGRKPDGADISGEPGVSWAR